jgi:hypothetical protein
MINCRKVGKQIVNTVASLPRFDRDQLNFKKKSICAVKNAAKSL